MKTATAERMAELLGLPLFRTPWFLPEYPEGEWGAWRISRTGIGIDHGYYSGCQVIAGTPVLLRRSPDDFELWEPWMSLTPHEIESQEPGCLCAHGHTVIMGLGMGWVALNAALNPAVAKVTVVERDSEVLELIVATGVVGQLPPEIAAKIEIVQADALEWEPTDPVDFLYADIWCPVADAAALGDTQRMQQNVKARKVYFWGQELRLYTATKQRFGPQAALTAAQLAVCAAEDLCLPLLLPWGDDYPAMIETSVRNRQARGLPMEEKA
ncbi:hypothetical protein [Pelobacter propionicus]|uniref:Spermidine synthase-like protein n=1 Tax=Pelobacter propionicus (strain DSM 2379 / NBRC 103807 / OttBd1) TaxID=338966 RepID=A1AK21_PELPD|nr:hypothetical protein [Pelobacter propionicus]ABK97691.1 conserved hypothetical protein [Pelobacter propionicus DSM 2379]